MESEDRERSDREQMDEQRQHQGGEAAPRAGGPSSGVERAEKAAARGAQITARQAGARAEELRRKAGLIDAEEREKEEKELKEIGERNRNKSRTETKTLGAARASARAVQRMLAGREPASRWSRDVSKTRVWRRCRARLEERVRPPAAARELPRLC